MTATRPIAIPPASMLAQFGTASQYRDCFAREVEGNISLPDFIQRFYCSIAFRPERLILSLIRRGASNSDALALARGEVEALAAWNVVSRNETEILLRDFKGSTASWLSVEALPDNQTRLLFGSWVGQADSGVMRALMPFHVRYAKVLLAGA